jgi:acetyl esterase
MDYVRCCYLPAAGGLSCEMTGRVALLMTADCDPLRDVGQASADRLRGLGVPVEHRFEPGLIHAGLNLFNSALYPDASRRVGPMLDALVEAIRVLAG